MKEIQRVFIDFERAISINSDIKSVLYDRMESAQGIIREAFDKNKSLPHFYFDLHGSFKTGTMTRTAKKVSDIDFGIYFSSKPEQSPKELKSILFNSLRKSNSKIENRDKLVRMTYDDSMNIDITMYYLRDKNNLPRLAREASWMPSDPVALYNWFLKVSSNQKQLVIIVKYLKYWSSLCQMKTPSGTAFCAWVGEHINNNTQIDISLFETTQSLLASLRYGVYCRNPVKPHDNLVKNLQPRHRKNFLDMLELFVYYSGKAISTEDQNESLQYWGNIFGEKFTACKTNLL